MGYITRRPVINKQKKIFAYKLVSTGSLSIQNKDLQKLLTGDRKTIIDYSNHELYNIITEYHKPEKTIIEFAGSRLQQLGEVPYLLRRSNFGLVFDYSNHPEPGVLNFNTDIIKFDFPGLTEQKRLHLIELCRNSKVKIMTAQINSNSDFNRAREEGCDYFLGNFYNNTSAGNTDIPAFKVNYLQLLQQINQPEPDFIRIEKIIKNDLSLSYNLFRLINSAYFGLKNEINSIKQALTLLGLNDFKKWLSLKIMRGLAEDRPDVLMEKSLLRAHFAENLASAAGGDKKLDFFVMGLFSLIDAFLNKPLENILADLSLSPGVENALLNYGGKPGKVLQLLENYEKARWEKVDQLRQQLTIDREILVNNYISSITSTREALQALL